MSNLKTNLKTFLRVLHAYSIEEKVISIIIFGIVFFLTIDIAISSFKNNVGNFNTENSYNEAIVSADNVILNPLFIDFSEANRDISTLIFSGLTKFDPEKNSFVDDMATLTINQDRTIYKFTLKDNLYWHDNEPLTADDVYFTFHDIIQNPEFQNPILRLNFEGVKITQIDKQNIEFELNKPNSFFITNMSIGILPKHLLENIPIKDLVSDTFNANPIGSGPYQIASALEVFDDGIKKVTLKSFPEFYDKKSQIQKISFHVYPDVNTLLNEKNGFNIISKIPSDYSSQLQNDNDFTLMEYELPQYTALFFNMEKEIFKKNKLAIALQKSLEKENLLKLLEHKIAVDTPLLELNQSEWIYKPNIEEAKGALFDSGYKLDETGFRKDSEGNPLELNLVATLYEEGTPLQKETKIVTDFIKKAFENVGIKINLRLVNSPQFREIIQTRDYDMILARQSLGYNLDTYSYWHSSQATENGLNLSNYESFAADTLIEKIRDTFDQTKKEQLLKDLAKEITNDVPAIFLYRPKYIFATDNKISGIKLENLAFPSDKFANIADWCIVCE